MSRLTSLPENWDMLVVGAGPAGMAAATVTASAGLSTLVIDEGPGPGGQIWRAIMTTPVMSRPVLGSDYWAGAPAVRAFYESGATYLPSTQVWSLDADGVAGLSADGRARYVSAKRVVIATGAMERPFPVPGWTLPGVMTAGAAQSLLKTSGLFPSDRLVIAGTGPLIWLYAAQLLAAGGRISALLDTTDPGARLAATRSFPAFAASPYLAKGLALMAKVRARVRVLRKVTALSIEGRDRVTAVGFRRGGGTEEQIPADTVLLHQGVVPQVNLAMAAGIGHRWDDRQLCFVPEIDPFGQTSLARIAIAGDGAGIGGWEAAVERGRLAGIGAARALGVAADLVPSPNPALKRLRKLARPRAFLDTFYRPAVAFRRPAPDTIVCRCEEVTAAEVEKAVDIGALGPAQLKSYTRCGMGPCQGRMCGLTVTELMAAKRGVSPAEIGYFRLRAPVKPITLAELASLPVDGANVKAVVRS
jgi:NADPH-dependent 2,4-dienoyl-CoA reductase/sulfur reductase-like enzyme